MATLRERVLAGETTVGCWLSSGSRVNAEVLGRAGYDWLVIDTEHGMGFEADILAQLYAIGTTPATALVRIERSDRLRVARSLDLGAGGLVVPRIESAAEVAETLSWMRFPPAGMRGVALGGRGQGFGQVGHGDIGTLNDRVLGIFQIETPAAIAAVDAIAAVPGADVLFVGPADLSHSLGVPGRFDDPVYLDAIGRVLRACEANGKAAGILLYDPAVVQRHLDLGFRFIGLGSDTGLLGIGARTMLATVGRA
jgi:4-hydroxy-2-oxoheptanedioate aldolase